MLFKGLLLLLALLPLAAVLFDIIVQSKKGLAKKWTDGSEELGKVARNQDFSDSKQQQPHNERKQFLYQNYSTGVRI